MVRTSILSDYKGTNLIKLLMTCKIQALNKN